jgi:hypothetical protein
MARAFDAGNDHNLGCATERAQPPTVMRLWPVALCVAAIFCAVVVAILLSRHPDSVAPAPPSLVAGTPGGVAVENQTPSARPTSTPSSPPSPTPSATAEPTATPTPVPVIATPAPTPTVAPATPPRTVAPTPIVVAASDPSDTVAAFYGYVSSGQFDAAYSLWSKRMRATYPRQANLDERFDQTASIDFQQLYVAEQSGDVARVQANFTETYDSGSSRVFVGYWRLVLVDGVWLLDEPHY